MFWDLIKVNVKVVLAKLIGEYENRNLQCKQVLKAGWINPTMMTKSTNIRQESSYETNCIVNPEAIQHSTQACFSILLNILFDS
jgi:hypothetical protein